MAQNAIIGNLLSDLLPGGGQQAGTTAPVTAASPLQTQGSSNLFAGLRPQAPTGGGGNALVKFAQQQIGKPYKWGAASGDTRWFDCSSLVQWAAGQAGIKLPRTTWGQMKLGAAVAGLAGAQPGDLLFFNGGSHVGIYMGNGQMIDAPHTGATVRQEPVWQNQLSSIRRL